MKLYANKRFLVDVSKAEMDKVIHAQSGSFTVRQGELVTTDQYGNIDIITQKMFDEQYVPVEVSEKKSKLKRKVARERTEDEMSRIADAYLQSWVNNDSYIDEVNI